MRNTTRHRNPKPSSRPNRYDYWHTVDQDSSTSSPPPTTRNYLKTIILCTCLLLLTYYYRASIPEFFFTIRFKSSTTTSSSKYCPEGYTLERHDLESSHGDVCRCKNNSYTCPSPNCHGTSPGKPPFCAMNDNTPCRVPRDKNEYSFRCDNNSGERGVCLLVNDGSNTARYKTSDCNGKCPQRKKKQCKEDWDCSLAGECIEGACHCDAWTEGHDCSYLKFQPVNPAQLGYLDKQHSSWGGNAIQGSDGVWHMVVTEIPCGEDDLRNRRCGLNAWQTQSRVVHASSSNVAGPYIRENEILPVYAHNPTIHVSPVDKSWHLYYISKYDGPIRVVTSTDEGGTWSDDITVSNQQNPAPFLHTDGTLTLYYRDDAIPLPEPNCADESIGAVHCPTPTSKCTKKSSTPKPLFQHTAEDPFVFQDHRGNYHMLMNALPYRCLPKKQQGGHAWSQDGIHWSEPRVGAFTTSIEFMLEDGTTDWIACERRERPQMILDPETGMPLAMVSALMNCPKDGRFFGKSGDGVYGGGDDCFTLVQLMSR